MLVLIFIMLLLITILKWEKKSQSNITYVIFLLAVSSMIVTLVISYAGIEKKVEKIPEYKQKNEVLQAECERLKNEMIEANPLTVDKIDQFLADYQILQEEIEYNSQKIYEYSYYTERGGKEEIEFWLFRFWKLK